MNPFILLIDRSNHCDVVEQVRNAQRAGASAVVIARAYCRCDDKDCDKGGYNGTCELRAPLADDGSGADILIPSFLMDKDDARKIKAELAINRPVQIRMSWGYQHNNRDDWIPYDFWFTPLHAIRNLFLRDFRVVVQALGEHIRFTPHPYLWDGFRLGCQKDYSKCNHSCTSGGHYCSSVLAEDPYLSWSQKVSGADVVHERLRRQCIWRRYKQIGEEVVWWDYIYWFLEFCESPDKFKDDACIDYVYDLANVTRDIVARCLEDSQKKGSTNVLLNEELQARTKFGVTKVPTLVVDGIIEDRFDSIPLTVANAFRYLCGRFYESSAPRACLECEHSIDVMDCLIRLEDYPNGEYSVPFPTQPTSRFEMAGKGQFVVWLWLIAFAVLVECILRKLRRVASKG
jgi:PA domain